MSYQVLARKWRPKDFSEMVGQDHVVRALSNALDNDRLHHAYLFTGTRGVGKTTLARILAKSLNCERGVSASPCGECGICQEVDEGRFVDLLEVDAASKTGVDDTRELLENVPYAPVRGRYKVYLIDEVHMFSSHSFNALLKTLEEPPPHVKFLLATTDPQKVPVTVLSRCLQFNLKRLPIEQIQGQFEHILGAEGVPAESEALQILARAADGSMRDGLSLLDQAIAFGGGAVKHEDVRTMLGVTAADALPQLIEAIHAGIASELLLQVDDLAQAAPDFAALLKDLLLLLHRVALVSASPDALQPSWSNAAQIGELANRLSAEDVQLYYQIALVGQRDLPLAPDTRTGFEMVLLRMLAFRPDVPGATAVAAEQADPRRKVHPPGETPPSKAAGPGVKTQAGSSETAFSSGAGEFDDWHQVVAGLSLSGLALQLASHCTVKTWDGSTLVLGVDPSCSSMLGSRAQQRLETALRGMRQKDLKLVLEVTDAVSDTPAQRAKQARADRQEDARQTINDDPLVKAVQDAFDAELIEESIRPVDQ